MTTLHLSRNDSNTGSEKPHPEKTKTSRGYDTSSNEWKELEEIIWHACYREFREEAHDPFFDEKDIASAATILLEQSADRISTMVANWIRVGFAQGNFNADNCLVSGKTMDYGPFGWLEEVSLTQSYRDHVWSHYYTLFLTRFAV